MIALIRLHLYSGHNIILLFLPRPFSVLCITLAFWLSPNIFFFTSLHQHLGHLLNSTPSNDKGEAEFNADSANTKMQIALSFSQYSISTINVMEMSLHLEKVVCFHCALTFTVCFVV